MAEILTNTPNDSKNQKCSDNDVKQVVLPPMKGM